MKEEVYTDPPPGFSAGIKTREVCKLKRASMERNNLLELSSEEDVYRQTNADHTLFIKQRKCMVTCLIIYVDNMIITGNDTEEMTRLCKHMFTKFEMNDLRGLKYFLGIEVLRSDNRIYILQRKYILDLLTEVGMLDCKPCDTPMAPNNKLQVTDGTPSADKGQYQCFW